MENMKKSTSELADILIKAHNENQLIPILSARASDIDVEAAYSIQKAYVEKRLNNEKIAGFKAGMTSESGQRKFGLNAPVAGVLFTSGKKVNNATINQAMSKNLKVETEIGFVIGKTISKPVEDVAKLRESIQAVMPVIELPDLGFADMQALKGVDIIAANVASAQFIVGQEREVKDWDLNAISVTLTLNDEQINSGKGTDAFGDQWKAALWLVNTMLEQGWTMEPGHIFITGVLGQMFPGNPGKYIADYRSFGKICFEIKGR